jgi:hypothetical protein
VTVDNYCRAEVASITIEEDTSSDGPSTFHVVAVLKPGRFRPHAQSLGFGAQLPHGVARLLSQRLVPGKDAAAHRVKHTLRSPSFQSRARAEKALEVFTAET